MPQDAFTLRYLCEELDGIFRGGKINRIVQPDLNATVFTVYTASGVKRLVLDANPSCPRIGVTEKEPPSPAVPSNFCMLLRKHLLSATVKSVKLVGFDRIVRIDFAPSTEFFDAAEKTVYAELMGRYSNVILTENGKVMGGNRGINFTDNNVRPLISGMKYLFPPVGDKKIPSDESIKSDFADMSGRGAKDCNLAERICERVQGIALSTAKEIEKLYFECNDCFDTENFFRFLNGYIYGAEKAPCVLFDGENAADVCVYPYKTLGGEVRYFDSLFLAEDFFFSEKEKRKNFKNLKDRLNAIVNSGLKKGKKRLSAVLARLSDASSSEDNRIKGELILANVYKLKGGEEEATFINYYDGKEITVALDKRLSPSENAEAYYKKYGKQKRAALSLAPQKESAESEIAYLESVSAEISLSDSFSDLKAVEEELIAAGLIKTPPKRGKKVENEPAPRIYDVFGWRVKAGRNNAENDRITFSSKPWDIWLHAKDFHSTHVIVETNGKKPPERVIVAAAEICAYYSKGREGGKTEIVYCEKKFVKKPKKSALGFCTYTDYKSVTVTPAEHAEMLQER